MKGPFRHIMDIRRRELPLALLMCLYFFLVITSFWILKPIKKTLFIGHYQAAGVDLGALHLDASQAELVAKILNMFVAFAAVAVFTRLARKLRRQQLTIVFSAFFMACYLVYGQLVGAPGDWTVWTFYLFGDLFSTLMVATFFAFLNDSVTPDMARRLYGLVGAGGVVGGAFGSLVVRVWIDRIPVVWWMWIAFAVAAVIVLVARAAGRLVDRDPPPVEPARKDAGERPSKGNAALEGARLVLRSRYLLAIVGVVGFYEIASTILDFQFTATVAHYVSGEAIGRHFSTVYSITNVTAMIVQLFFTSFVMTRFGVKAALLVLPAAILLSSAGFAVLPLLWMGSLLNTADNAFSYSINQSAKEALYVPTTRDEKYKAKAFIDMFVQRFAKALAVGVSLFITTRFRSFASVRWLSLVVLVIAAAWIFTVRYAGTRFQEMEEARRDA